MSQIAEDTGIGRATLYKYFPDVESILIAWHERHVAGHLDHLVELRDKADLVALVHQGEHVSRTEHQLRDLVRDLITEAAKTGHVRDDVVPDELTSYCLHALSAASSLASKAAIHRLVRVTLAGLRPGGDTA